MTGEELEAIRQAWARVEALRDDEGISSGHWVALASSAHGRVPALLDEIERLRAEIRWAIDWCNDPSQPEPMVAIAALARAVRPVEAE